MGFNYPNYLLIRTLLLFPEDKGVRITEGLLYSIQSETCILYVIQDINFSNNDIFSMEYHNYCELFNISQS